MANDYTPQQIEEILQMFFDVAGTRQYIGARYVPIFGRGRGTPVDWDNSDAYEPLSIVYYQGDTYTSRRYVPAGIPIDNQDYWVITGRYNAQVEQYRQEVLGFSDRINGAYEAVEILRNQVVDDYVPFPDSDHYPKYGTLGQVLTTLADGETKWEDPVVPSDAQAEAVITQWLADHPEATTTVQDGSITAAKLNSALSSKLYQIVTTQSTDLNDYTQIGSYSVNATYTNVPSNMLTHGMLTVLTYSNTRILQILSSGGILPHLWFRTYANTESGYSEWYEFYPTYVKSVATNSTDVNDYTEIGGYTVDSSYSNVPSDMTSNGTLHCFNISTTRKLQLIAVGGNSPQIYFRTWANGPTGFGPWNKLYPIALPESDDEIRLSYSDTNKYTIDLGAVTLFLTYTNNASTDSDLWNVNQPIIKATSTPVDTGDIIGPIRVNGASDFTFGIHGSATTTVFGVYMDGEEVTLNNSTDVTGNELTILMHDEGRHPDTQVHIFDRDVTIRISKGKLWCSNTIKNVSGGTLTIQAACNGGLIAAFKNIMNGISTNDFISKVPVAASVADSPNITSCTFMLDGCTMSARNIIGHENASYIGDVVNYDGDPGRNKVYFYTAKNYQMTDGSSIYGEFEYEYR